MTGLILWFLRNSSLIVRQTSSSRNESVHPLLISFASSPAFQRPVAILLRRKALLRSLFEDLLGGLPDGWVMESDFAVVPVFGTPKVDVAHARLLRERYVFLQPGSIERFVLFL